MENAHVISGLREKRSTIAGALIDTQRELDRLQADLFHIDAVLKLYGEEPADIPTKGRMPKRSTYFGRNEISRRCYDLLREKGAATAADVAVRAMREKGLDPESDRKLRVDFTKRILVTLHDLLKNGTVRKLGAGKGVRWELVDGQSGDDSV